MEKHSPYPTVVIKEKKIFFHHNEKKKINGDQLLMRVDILEVRAWYGQANLAE